MVNECISGDMCICACAGVKRMVGGRIGIPKSSKSKLEEERFLSVL